MGWITTICHSRCAASEKQGSPITPSSGTAALWPVLLQISMSGHGLTPQDWELLWSPRGSSNAPFRRELEAVNRKRVHLCRNRTCNKVGFELHIKETATIDADSVVDLAVLANGSTAYRSLVLIWRTIHWLVRFPFYIICAIGRFGYRRCLRREQGMVTQTVITARGPIDRPLELHDDSESEFDEEEEHPCEAVRIGICGGGRAKPLCSKGCHDRSLTQGTPPLVEDAQVSELPPPSEGSSIQASLIIMIKSTGLRATSTSV